MQTGLKQPKEMHPGRKNQELPPDGLSWPGELCPTPVSSAQAGEQDRGVGMLPAFSQGKGRGWAAGWQGISRGVGAGEQAFAMRHFTSTVFRTRQGAYSHLFLAHLLYPALNRGSVAVCSLAF